MKRGVNGELLTEGGTMTVKEHYRLSAPTPRDLAGNDCCKWHTNMKGGEDVKRDVFVGHPKYKKVKVIY